MTTSIVKKWTVVTAMLPAVLTAFLAGSAVSQTADTRTQQQQQTAPRTETPATRENRTTPRQNTEPARRQLPTPRVKTLPPVKAPAVRKSGRQPALLLRTASVCIRSSEEVLVQGNDFGASAKEKGYELRAYGQKGPVAIKIIDWSRRQIRFSLRHRPDPSDGPLLRLHLQGASGPVSQNLNIFFCRPDQRQAREDQNAPASAQAAREIVFLIPLSNDARYAELATELRQSGYRIIAQTALDTLGLYSFLIVLPQGEDAADALDALRSRYPQAVIDRNHSFNAAASPLSFGHDLIQWPKSTATCHAQLQQTAIGMLDGGVDTALPIFQGGRHIRQRNFVRGRDKSVADNHGTGIAALLTARGLNAGERGLLPGHPLWVADIFRQVNDRRSARTEAMLRGLNWLAKEGVRVVNLSLAGPANRALAQAIQQADKIGMVLIAAAGNKGPRAAPLYPALDRRVIAITALDVDKQVFRRANRGPYIDFAAPGVDIWLAKAGGGASFRSGTSFAAPFATALAVSYLAALSDTPAGNARAYIQARMKAAALDIGPPGRDNTFGHGLITARNICGN